jgi:maleylacetoacetate isomerase
VRTDDIARPEAIRNTPGDVVLWDYWRSTASYRVRIALNLAGIGYRSVPVDLVAGEQRHPAHLARNPQGLVPVLRIDGVELTQSLAIIDYLQDTGRLALRPADPLGRARVRAVALAIAAEMHPVCNARILARVEALAGRSEARGEWVRATLEPELKAVEAMLPEGKGPYAFGAKITEADLCIVPQIYNARRWEVDLGPTPRLAAIDAACATHPAFAAAHPDRVRAVLDQAPA